MSNDGKLAISTTDTTLRGTTNYANLVALLDNEAKTTTNVTLEIVYGIDFQWEQEDFCRQILEGEAHAVSIVHNAANAESYTKQIQPYSQNDSERLAECNLVVLKNP